MGIIQPRCENIRTMGFNYTITDALWLNNTPTTDLQLNTIEMTYIQ